MGWSIQTVIPFVIALFAAGGIILYVLFRSEHDHHDESPRRPRLNHDYKEDEQEVAGEEREKEKETTVKE